MPRITEIIDGAMTADFENTRLQRQTFRHFGFHSSSGDKRSHVDRGLIVIAKRGDVLLAIDFRHRATKRRRDNQIVRIIPKVAALKMRIVIVSKKKGIGKLRTQRSIYEG